MMRRWISLAIAVVMALPAVGSAAEAAVANWLSPAPGQIVTGKKVEVAIGYNTGSNLKVTSLVLYVDGKFNTRKVLVAPASRGVCSFWWNTTGVEQGAHSLVVKVYAGDKMVSKVSGTGTVGAGYNGGAMDMTPPVVTFANIKTNDMLKGTFNIKMNAYDNSSQSPMVSLLVDDVLKMLRNTPPYNYELDTTTYPDGDHQLKTYAYDSAGNKSDPAIVKVAFKNGVDHPVVTTMSVNHDSEPVRSEAKVSKVVPPALTGALSPSVRKNAAARAESRMIESISIVEPIAEAPKQIAFEPKPVVKISASPKKTVTTALSAKPDAVKVSAPSANVRKESSKPVMMASSKLTEPSAMENPVASGVRSVSASRLPASKPNLKVSALPSTAVEPEMPKANPVKSQVTRMAMAPVSLLRTENRPVIMDSAAGVPDEEMAQPTTSSVRNIAASSLGKLRSIESSKAIASKLAVPAAPVSGEVKSAKTKHVQVALAPNFKSAVINARAHISVACPPSIPKSPAARIEKRTKAAVAGKVKARDIFENMGGVLFWDSDTHTVRAYVHDMVIEMRIGSHIAKVNGHSMHVQFAPYISDGRTIIEASLYSQAVDFLDQLKNISSAKIK